VTVSLLSVAGRPVRATASAPPKPRPWLLPSLILLAYVCLAVGLTWRLWAAPATMAPNNGGPGISRDIYLNVWFMRYAATAVSHGNLPALVTTAVNYPQGINAMWNTSLLLPSVLLTPVTLLAGPMVSLTALLTAGFAGSAAIMFAVLRRWGASLGAAAAGGALYGFSPAIMVAAEDHYHLQFALLPPLIASAVLRLVTGRTYRQPQPSAGAVPVAAVLEGPAVRTVRGPRHRRPRFASLRRWAALLARPVLPPLRASRRCIAWARSVLARHAWIRALLTGGWLGILVAAQLLIAEELLVDTAIACLVLAAALAVCRPSAVLALRRPVGVLVRLGLAALACVVAAAVALLLAGHALMVQFRGPLSEKGSPWHIGQYGNQPANFVTAPNAMLQHGDFWLFLKHTNQFLVEAYAYLGWPMLGLLAVLTVVCWRDARVRVTAVSFAVLELLSLGGHRIHAGSWQVPFYLQPWHWLWHLPVLAQVVPNRISILADGAAAVLIAFSIDRMRVMAPRRRAWRWAVLAAVAAAIAGAVVPIVPRPVPAVAVDPSPPGWQAAFAALRLPAGSPVLVLPVSGALTMEWQAMPDIPISVVGGYCIVRQLGGAAAQCDTIATLGAAQETTVLRFNQLAQGLPQAHPPAPTTMAAAVLQWRATAVVTTAGGQPRLIAFLTKFLGPPAVVRGQIYGWRVNEHRLYMADAGRPPRPQPALGRKLGEIHLRPPNWASRSGSWPARDPSGPP
jgi:hypothetical protein